MIVLIIIARTHAKLQRARYWYKNSLSPSLRSITLRYCVRTAKRILEILSSPGSPLSQITEN